MRIVLTGFMGTGKTVVGRRLATRLGRTLLDERNYQALAKDGFLVCLTASPRTIARRVRGSVHERPLLHGHPSLAGRIRELLEARAPMYARIPVQIDTSSLSVDEVVT